jgi:hypothetical protein
MNDFRVAGTELDLLHILILIGVQGNHEAAELIGTFSRHRIGLRHFERLVRLAGEPTVGEFWQRGFVGRVAFRRAVFGPIADGCDLLVGQPAHVQEIAVPRSGFPRRHHVRLGDVRELFCPFGRILISEQSEWRDFAGPVAIRAVLIKDRRNVAVKRRNRRGRQTGKR